MLTFWFHVFEIAVNDGWLMNYVAACVFQRAFRCMCFIKARFYNVCFCVSKSRSLYSSTTIFLQPAQTQTDGFFKVFDRPFPIGFTIKIHPNVGKYSLYMDPVGLWFGVTTCVLSINRSFGIITWWSDAHESILNFHIGTFGIRFFPTCFIGTGIFTY